MSKLDEEQESINLYSGRDCLEFHGIPECSGENTEELVKRVGNLGRVEIGPSDISVKADFHSVQNVARLTFSERFLLNYKQSSGTNLISCG